MSDNRRLVIVARSVRAFADGYAAVLFPLYLMSLGFEEQRVGVISSMMLIGPTFVMLLISARVVRLPLRSTFLLASLLMIVTGLGFAALESFWALAVLALIGTMNPSGGEMNLFRPLDQTLIAHSVPGHAMMTAYVGYGFAGALFGACGALVSGAVDLFDGPLDRQSFIKALFVLYAAFGLVNLFLYRRLDLTQAGTVEPRIEPLAGSRRRVYRLALLFALDAFAGGFVVNALLVLWLVERFDVAVSAVSTILFAATMLAALAQFASVPLARRFGLINTIVVTHAPGGACLILAALAPTIWAAGFFLILRGLLSQMDVAARTSYVMSVVTPSERAAAAILTVLPFSIAAAAGSALSGWLMEHGDGAWPLIVAGSGKLLYDLLLYASYRRDQEPGRHRPEDRAAAGSGQRSDAGH